MKYIKIMIKTTEYNVEKISEELYLLGITNIEIVDSDSNIIVYFDDNKKGKKEADKLSNRYLAEVVTVDDNDWKNKWKEYYHSTVLTSEIVVYPTWEKYNGEAGKTAIEIDPQDAFGTGMHDTTILCAELLQEYMTKGDYVLDVGCGTGLLSIVVYKLGAAKVLGIDIDKDSVIAAKRNVLLNDADDVVKIAHANLIEGIEFRSDIVVANLLSDIVIRLVENIGQIIKSNGIFISSGILIEQKEDVIQVIKDNGFNIIEVREKGMWCAIAARKQI